MDADIQEPDDDDGGDRSGRPPLRDCGYDGGRKLPRKGGNDHEPAGDVNLAGCGSRNQSKQPRSKPSHQRKRGAITGKFDDRRRQKCLTFNIQSLSLVILPYMSHSVSQSAAMCQFSGAWAAEAAPAHAAPRSPRPQPLSALCDTLSWAYSRMCWNRLWYKWCCQGAGSWSLGNERRCVEAFDNQPHSDDHLPQAACDRGNITQTGPHDCRDHPAQNDRVS